MLKSPLSQTLVIVAIYLVGAYVGLALLGQGLALKMYSQVNVTQMPDGGGVGGAKITDVRTIGLINPKYVIRVSNYPQEMLIPAEVALEADLGSLKVGSTVTVRTWGNIRSGLPPFILGLDLVSGAESKTLLDYETSVRKLTTAKIGAFSLGETRIKQAVIPMILAIIGHLFFSRWYLPSRRRLT